MAVSISFLLPAHSKVGTTERFGSERQKIKNVRNGTGKNNIEEEYVLVEVEYLMEGNSSSCYQVYDYLGKKITQVCNEKESNLLYLNISDRPRFFVV